MNDTEKALVIIHSLPTESLEEFLLISAISPFNTDKGYKLSPKGRATLRKILESKITSMEMVSMTHTDAAVLEGSASLLRLYKATYDITENLDQPYKNSEELAKFDEEFFQSLEKMPIIKEIIKYLAKEFKAV